MSTDPKTLEGGKALADDLIADAKALFEAATVEEQQLELLDPISPEEMLEAREAIGPGAGRLAVLQEARKRRKGRPKGARNKRTDDFAKYLMQFGQHPAITMMQIQSTPPDVLIEASKQQKVHSFNKYGEPNLVTERMTYEAAQALRVRCAEGLMPFLESKKPVAVDATIRGVMLVEEIGRVDRGRTIDGEVLGVMPIGEDGDE